MLNTSKKILFNTFSLSGPFCSFSSTDKSNIYCQGVDSEEDHKLDNRQFFFKRIFSLFYPFFMKEREGGGRLKSKNQLFYDLDFASGSISTFSVGGVLI